ncbi:MAG: glycosyltransferase family 4 protein [Candidatus Lokiarchaeota archaeon]|nr:glycosyltransferase family 4 protein [Candidatus Lokiarchaeota archaeon]
MIKIYISNISKVSIGGGYSFLRNFKKGMQGKVEFVNRWQDSDIVFIFSITTIDKNEIKEAKKAGKKIVMRVDNIPRKSRNKRQSPAERLREFGKISDLIIYQSKWSKKYAGYFAGEGVIILNGVDTEIFNSEDRRLDKVQTYGYINYNDNPNKRFDEALYLYDMEWRKSADDAKPILRIAGNVPSIYRDNPEYNWDIPTEAKVEYVGILDTPEQVAFYLKGIECIIYPSFAEACPNTLLEALACGCGFIGINETGGTVEVINDYNERAGYIKSIQEMCDEYLKELNKLI